MILKPGSKAHDIVAPAVVDDQIRMFYLSSCLRKFVMLLFYPNDFPIICQDEIPSFFRLAGSFASVDCNLVFISTDSHVAHMAYSRAPRQMGGLGGDCPFPLVSDKLKHISQRYGMLDDTSESCYRGSVLVDPEGVVRTIMYHDFDMPRDPHKLLKIASAHRIIFGEPHKKIYCPEGWVPGDEVLIEKEDASEAAGDDARTEWMKHALNKPIRSSHMRYA